MALGRGIGGLEADFYLGWVTFVKKNTGETTKKRIFSKPYSGVAARRRLCKREQVAIETRDRVKKKHCVKPLAAGIGKLFK